MLGQAGGTENNTGNNPVKGMGIQVIQIPSESCKLTRTCRMKRNYSSGKSCLQNPTGQGRRKGRGGRDRQNLHPKTLRVAGGPPGWTLQWMML